MGLIIVKEASYDFFKLYTVQGHITSTALTKDSDVAANSYYLKDGRAAGMLLFQLYYIASVEFDNFHKQAPTQNFTNCNYTTFSHRDKGVWLKFSICLQFIPK